MSNCDDQVWLIGCGASSARVASVGDMGFKAYNLWRMERLAMPVPQAFVLGTDFCREYSSLGRRSPAGLRELIRSRVHELERATGMGFGSPRKPLAVSVRSGAPVSMPGMLETVLDVGICDATVPGLLRLTGNPRLVWDSYRRLVQSFAEVVHRIPSTRFDAALEARMREADMSMAGELDFQSLRALARDFLDLFEELAGTPFPQQPIEQLEAAIIAVWASWDGEKAVQYRRINGLSDELGTAVTVQRMVYGNAGGTSGAGVAFTRDPSTGNPSLYLDFMFNAQGDDVVAGRRTACDGDRLVAVLPSVQHELARVARSLEAEFRDMQEFEFTVQDGKLYILQTRTGKRTQWAELRIAVDQVEEGLIDEQTALKRLSPYELNRIERTRVAAPGLALCHGISAGGGVAHGEIVLDSDRALAVAREGRESILLRASTSTDDIAGIEAAAGVLTAAGSRTSHAAVVARQLNKVCIVGCQALSVDLQRRRCSLAGRWFDEGDVLSLDGTSGGIFAGAVSVEVEKPSEYIARLDRWREVAKAA
jgi:pyruvate,orthophosphate dikinase